MDSALQCNDFVGNNDAVDVVHRRHRWPEQRRRCTARSTATSLLNVPAAYVLLAGGNITNTGNIFAQHGQWSMPACAAAPTLATVNGVTGVTVNRLWDVTDWHRGGVLRSSGRSRRYRDRHAGSSIVNTGSISAGCVGFVVLEASGDIRSGTLGSNDTLVGLFADDGIFIDSYSNSSKVELYNVVSGYTTNKTLPFLLT